MIPLAADEDFDHHIVLGARRKAPGLDVLRVQDAGLRTAKDPQVLLWAAAEGRVLFTHDTNTMPKHFDAHVRRGLYTPGVCIVPQSLPIGDAIRELIVVAACSDPGEHDGVILYLPL